jgi:hypothetical protein
VQSPLGQFLKQKRLALNIAERNFAILIDVKPSWWNAIERGLEPLPLDADLFSKIVDVLGIKSPEELDQFVDLAAQAIPTKPDGVLTDEELVKYLPVCFRTVNGEKPARDQLLNFAGLLRQKLAG